MNLTKESAIVLATQQRQLLSLYHCADFHEGSISRDAHEERESPRADSLGTALAFLGTRQPRATIDATSEVLKQWSVVGQKRGL